MESVLILYATVDGHTKKISESLARSFQVLGFEPRVVPVTQVQDVQLDTFTHLVIGASIRYGHHAKSIHEFVEHHRELLIKKKAAFFSVNLVARKLEKRDPYVNPYSKKFLQQMNWHPACAAVFAGRLNYPMYSFWDKLMIRLIMWITHGPTDPHADIEFTDWIQVEEFAAAVVQVNSVNEP